MGVVIGVEDLPAQAHMRWFKHLTTASEDEFIASLEQKFGLEGYARWFKLLEAIGKGMGRGERSKCFSELPLSEWQRRLKTQRKPLFEFLEYLRINDRARISPWPRNEQEFRQSSETSALWQDFFPEKLRIEVPKLLKFVDEYQKKSGHTPDKLPSEIDTEDKKKKRTPETPAARAADSESEDLDPEAYLIWKSGVELVGESKRGLLGKLVKQHGQSVVASKVAELMAMSEKPRDPASYLVGALRKQERRFVC
jgi:hypothetical protein